MNMFGTAAPKSIPGVPYDIQRIYNQLTPQPKVSSFFFRFHLKSFFDSYSEKRNFYKMHTKEDLLSKFFVKNRVYRRYIDDF